MAVVIRKSVNGPYVVEGEVELIDANGMKYSVPESFSLCRCGASKRPPFCDASHNRIGFREDSDACFEE